MKYLHVIEIANMELNQQNAELNRIMISQPTGKLT